MKEGEGIDLSISPTVNYMDMTDKGVLEMKMWLRINWKDERLSWNPEEYGGVSQLNVPFDKVWMPDVICFNGLSCGPDSTAKAFDIARRHTPVVINASGDMTQVTTNLDVKVQCADEEFANWPWGEYDCKVIFGSWTYKGAEIKLAAGGGNFYMDNSNMMVNSPLIITENSFKEDPLDVKTYGTDDEYMSLKYDFKVIFFFILRKHNSY